MGVMQDEIRFNYHKTMKQAEDLENLARRLNALVSRDIQDGINDIAASWNGETGDDYVKKGERLKQKMAMNAKNLDFAASALKTIAITTYQAEMRAVSLFEKG